MNRTDRAELRALRDRATPGPWADCVFGDGYATAPDERGVHAPTAASAYIKPDGTWHALHICRGMIGTNRENNARYIAAACNAVPDLLDLIDQLETELAEYRTPSACLVCGGPFDPTVPGYWCPVCDAKKEA